MPHPVFSRLAPYGWSERVAAQLASALDDGFRPARVIGVERAGMRIVTVEKETILSGGWDLAVGDWVALKETSPAVVAPRWSTLTRLDPEGHRQVLATNIDLVLITAPADRLSATRVERELVIAWDSGATPVVVVTKTDLAPPGALERLQDRLSTSEVIPTSALDGSGLDRLRNLLGHPSSAALLGPSGAGKSTLINALLGRPLLPVGAVRDRDHRGRHTTTSRRLIPLPSGGSLLDMPGLRALATDASADAVEAAFPEIDQLAAGCRFSDCTHTLEPGCAVIAAVDRDELDADRLSNYRKLERELAHQRLQVDRRARQVELRRWKTIQKAHRRNPKRGLT